MKRRSEYTWSFAASQFNGIVTTMPPRIPHAILWHGQALEPDHTRIQTTAGELQVAPADVTVIDGAQLSIQELLTVKQFASRTPTMSRFKLIVILAADRLSLPVANALLKLIEEPPGYLLIRLNAAHAAAVLPTIRSRCQLEFIGQAVAIDGRYPLAELDMQSLSEQFAVAQALATDPAVESVVTGWLTELEQRLLQGYPVSASIAAGLTLVERLRTNSNRRLALEAWLLTHAASQRTKD